MYFFLQKHQKTGAEEMVSEAKNDPTFINTVDETRVDKYDVHFKQRMETEKCMNKLVNNVFDYRGVVHYEYLLPGQSIRVFLIF